MQHIIHLLIMGLDTPHGVNTALFRGIEALVGDAYGDEAVKVLNNFVDATDGYFYIGEDMAEDAFKAILEAAGEELLDIDLPEEYNLVLPSCEEEDTD